jgi:hypothetical protein
MPSFRFVADVHIGNHKLHGGEVLAGINKRAHHILNTLADVSIAAAEANETLVVLGDLFDTSHPTPQLVAATMRALNATAPNTILLLGNHDMVSSTRGDNALIPFEAAQRGAVVVDRPRCMRYTNGVGDAEHALLLVPFRPEPMHEWFAETVGELLANAHGADLRTLCFHGGVRDHNTPKYLWNAPDSIDIELLKDIMKRGGIARAFCGNWHSPKEWMDASLHITQVGALVPTGFDNEGWGIGRSVGMDDQMNVRVRRHPGPRFVKTSAARIKSAHALNTVTEMAEAVGTELVFWRYELADGETQEDALALMEKVGLTPYGGVSFTQAEEDTEQQEAEAAEAAKVSDNLDENVRGYVEAMPLPEGVEREAVHSLVNRYIGRG